MKKAIGYLLSIVVVAGVAGFSYFSGGELGGECEEGFFGCKGAVFNLFGPTCLLDVSTGVGYCTVDCAADLECTQQMGPGWGCRGSSVLDENGTETGQSKMVCYSPQDIAIMDGTAVPGMPGAIPQPVPGAVPQPVPAPVPGATPQPVPVPAPQPTQ